MRHRLRLFLFAFGVAVGFLLSRQAVNAHAQTAPSDEEDAVVMLDGWQYRWGDAPLDARGTPVWTYDAQATGWQPASVLTNPPGEAQDFLWLRVRLPDVLPEAAAVGTRFLWYGVEVYLDSTQIYHRATLGPDPRNKYQGVVPHLIPLPEHAAGRFLYFRLYSEHSALIGIPDAVYLASQGRVVQFALRKSIGSLVIGAFLFFIGVLAWILLITVRNRPYTLPLFYVGLLSFCFGLNYINDHTASYLILGAPALQYYLMGAFALFPVGLLGFFEQMIGAGYKSIIRRLWQAHLVVWAGAILLDIFNVTPFIALGPVVFGLVAISLVVMIVTVIPATRGGQPEARIFGLGLVVAVVLGFIDTIVHGVLGRLDMPQLAPWGVLVFILVLMHLLQRRFTENTRQLQEAHTQLEAYSTTLEQRVAERTEALAQSLDELKTTQDQLIHAEKMASLGKLTAGIAHEIKNPLNFVNNFAQLSIELADELEEEIDAQSPRQVGEVQEELKDLLADLKHNAAKIHEHGQRADGIVRNMLAHSSTRTGARQATDFNALVSEYIDLAYHGKRAQVPDFNATIERALSDSAGTVVVVPQEIARVLLNLLGNAFDAVHEHAQTVDGPYTPTVTVSTRRVGDTAEVRVQDNGGGIPFEARDRIFEPFFTTKPAGSGTGLGLSLSYDIVTQGHGGTLTVESEEGHGATFIVTLPGNHEEADSRS